MKELSKLKKYFKTARDETQTTDHKNVARICGRIKVFLTRVVRERYFLLK
jgi:hypothetical protein